MSKVCVSIGIRLFFLIQFCETDFHNKSPFSKQLNFNINTSQQHKKKLITIFFFACKKAMGIKRINKGNASRCR